MTTAQPLGYEQIFVEGLNRGDVRGAAPQAFAPDCVIHISGFPDPIVGLEAWMETVSGVLAAFPGLHFTIEEQISVGDTTVTRFRARGTHNGPFGPIPATGRAVAFDGLILDHLVDGKVHERWEQFDQALILMQLGVA